jgi:hypothetical protein
MPHQAIGDAIEAALLAQLKVPVYAGLAAANVVSRTLIHIGEGIAPTLPALLLAPGQDRESREMADTEGGAYMIYPFTVALIAAANRNLNPDPVLRLWREQAEHVCDSDAAHAAIAATVAGTVAATVWLIEIDGDALLDAAKLADNWKFSAFTVLVHAYVMR